jgi:hypothetical protein
MSAAGIFLFVFCLFSVCFEADIELVKHLIEMLSCNELLQLPKLAVIHPFVEDLDSMKSARTYEAVRISRTMIPFEHLIDDPSMMRPASPCRPPCRPGPRSIFFISGLYRGVRHEQSISQHAFSSIQSTGTIVRVVMYSLVIAKIALNYSSKAHSP